MESFFFISESLYSTFAILISYWWLYMPLLLFFGLVGAYSSYTRLRYLQGLKWALLELTPPKDPGKSPKATENMFSTLHAIYFGSVRWRDAFFKGKVQDWFSFEIAGTGGEIRFFVRVPEQYKKLVQAQIYAQYPDSEIVEVAENDDYVKQFPLSAPDETTDLWGAEFALAKDDVFPIKTYPEFEEKPSGPTDIKRIDPLASLSEVMAGLDAGEHLCVQMLIRGTSDAWVKKGAAALDKLQGKIPKAPGADLVSQAIWEIDKIIPGHLEVKKEEKKPEVKEMTPGKQEALKAAEKKMSKLGFKTGIRFIYIAPKEKFHRAHISSVIGAFKQFASQSLNSFKLNMKTATFATGFFKAQKEYEKKIFLYNKFINRVFPSRPFILNTEELATIYHFPDIGVKSPLLPRVEAKKGEPPVGLPIS